MVSILTFILLLAVNAIIDAIYTKQKKHRFYRFYLNYVMLYSANSGRYLYLRIVVYYKTLR